jgi:hypothetical protein
MGAFARHPLDRDCDDLNRLDHQHTTVAPGGRPINNQAVALGIE